MSLHSCSTCGELLPEDEFHRNAAMRFGISSKCKSCTREYDSGYYARNREKILRNKRVYGIENSSRIRKKKAECSYGISRNEYDYMQFTQDYKCAICGGPPGKKSLSIDHCHETGEIRGLLCGSCNTSLGGFRDNPDVLLSALSYIGYEVI